MDKPTPAAARAKLGRSQSLEQPLRVRPGGQKPARASGAIESAARLVGTAKRPRLATASSGSRGRTSGSSSPGFGGASSTSRLKGRGLLGSWSTGHPRSQRVVVKARVVRNRGTGGRKTLARHVNYVERDGVDESGGRGQSFGRDGPLPERDVVEFVESAQDDRHHFRIMVTPERGGELNLRRYTQEVMTQVEADLGTEIRWLAVEHHNTGHPHVHIVARGVDQHGADLVINRAYISQGLRARAQALATETLGLRPERELEQERARDIGADNLTYLDRRMIETAERSGGVVDVRRSVPLTVGYREQLRQQSAARLERLRAMGYATEVAPGQWRLDPKLADKLRTRGQQLTFAKEVTERLGPRYRYRSVALYNKEAPPEARLVGEVVDRRRVDEISETEVLTVASTRGDLHRVTLSQFSEATGDAVRVGDIVAVTVASRATVSNADRNIVRFARDNDGIYDADLHRSAVIRNPRFGPEIDPDTYVANHVKRLDGLVRRGLVEPIDALRYRVPGDLVAQLESAPPSGRDSGGVVKVERLSALSLREQVRAIGSTWLDGELEAHGGFQSAEGNGSTTVERRLIAASRARMARLEARGLLDVKDGERRVTRATLDRLYLDELSLRAKALSATYGEHLPAAGRRHFIGTVERLEPLASGVHAVVANGEGFLLIPAQGALGRSLGRQLGRRIDLSLEWGVDRVRLLERNIRFVALDLPRLERGLGR